MGSPPCTDSSYCWCHCRFLDNDLDYEKAEESYLKAIKIDPKRKKPYLKLADIYVAQEKYDKAVKILEDASKNVTVTEKKGEDKQNISEVKQEIETMQL